MSRLKRVSLSGTSNRHRRAEDEAGSDILLTSVPSLPLFYSWNGFSKIVISLLLATACISDKAAGGTGTVLNKNSLVQLLLLCEKGGLAAQNENICEHLEMLEPFVVSTEELACHVTSTSKKKAWHFRTIYEFSDHLNFAITKAYNFCDRKPLSLTELLDRIERITKMFKKEQILYLDNLHENMVKTLLRIEDYSDFEVVRQRQIPRYVYYLALEYLVNGSTGIAEARNFVARHGMPQCCEIQDSVRLLSEERIMPFLFLLYGSRIRRLNCLFIDGSCNLGETAYRMLAACKLRSLEKPLFTVQDVYEDAPDLSQIACQKRLAFSHFDEISFILIKNEWNIMKNCLLISPKLTAISLYLILDLQRHPFHSLMINEQVLSRLTNLTICFYQHALTSQDMQFFRKMRTLASLRIQNLSLYPYGILHMFGEVPAFADTLRELSLEAPLPLTHEDWLAISRLKNLEKLELERVGTLHGNLATVFGKAGNISKTLVVLKITSIVLNQNVLDAIDNLKNLRSLTCSDCKEFKYLSWSGLLSGAGRNWTELSLVRCNIEVVSAIRSICEHTRLKKLEIKGTPHALKTFIQKIEPFHCLSHSLEELYLECDSFPALNIAESKKIRSFKNIRSFKTTIETLTTSSGLFDITAADSIVDLSLPSASSLYMRVFHTNVPTAIRTLLCSVAVTKLKLFILADDASPDDIPGTEKPAFLQLFTVLSRMKRLSHLTITFSRDTFSMACIHTVFRPQSPLLNSLATVQLRGINSQFWSNISSLIRSVEQKRRIQVSCDHIY